MAEVLLSMIGEVMLNKVISLAADEVTLAWGFNDKLQKLEENLRNVKSLMSDASSKTQLQSVQEWLKGLNKVADDAEAVLDEFSYETLRRKIKNRKRDKVASMISLSENRFVIRQQLAHRIRKVNVSLDEIYQKGIAQINLAVILAPTTTESNERLEQHPFIDDSNVVGRDDDVEKVVDMLCGSDNPGGDDDLPVVAITGIGGQGKTTLAKLVCKHDKVSKHFDKVIWITVSESFDVKRILNEMIESLTGEKSELSNIQGIVKEKLSPALQMKRYLLVLDDVWNQDGEKWSCFRTALLEIKAADGSRILTTTRDIGVASTMNTSLNYMLQRLSESESWTLFKKRAFAPGGAEETEPLVRIGKEIVNKCHGLPLAIKVIGSLMFTKKSENEWLLVQNSLLWNLDDNTNRVVQSLKLSYDHLSFPLKRCFSFCSFYLKDKEIKKDELIQRWMALGLLQPPLDSGLTMEDVGDKYFNTLLSCSLLEDVKKDEMKAISLCKMHDIVHDLALDTVEKDYSILKSQALVSSQVNSKLNLRVLVFNDWTMKNLPDSIKKLKHLRYLDISLTLISVLPNSITKLYNLQTLKIRLLERVPEELNNLINLRRLCVKYISGSRDCMLIGLGKLTCLQTLPFFVVKQERGCHITELACLKDLRGDLKIFGLEHVESADEAKQALLSEKFGLRTLTLEWWEQRENGDGGIYNDENVMKGLEPHSKLEGLAIENFKGRIFPQWMMVASHASQVLGKLVKLRLSNCDECERIPAIGQLQHLKVVEISGMSNVESIGQEFYGQYTIKGGDVSSSSGGNTVVTIFPALIELTVKGLQKLERWEEAVQQQSTGSTKVFPCLKKLHIEDCQSLKSLPGHFPSVTDLKIKGIDDLMSVKEMSRTLTTLTSLKIVDCNGSEFESVLGELLGNSNRSLTQLKITECDEFQYLPENLVTLEKLEIISCSKLIGLASLTEAFPVLEKLEIRDCDSMVEFPDMLSHMCLRELSIWRMKNLTSVPNLCKSLQFLKISGCDRLTCLPVKLGKALRFVNIIHCSDLVCLPDFRYVQRLVLLKVGQVCSSEGVDCFPWSSSSCDVLEEEENDDIQCLEELQLRGWAEIKSLPEQLQQLTALTHLELFDFDGLESLPDWLGNLSSLQHIELWDCKNLKYLPSVEAMKRLTKLDQLFIYDCPLLKSRCMKFTRPEWKKISHIPNIQIDFDTIKGNIIEWRDTKSMDF